MKPYRLLRNNNETGPYSAEELIAMGLKAYDLIWVDGKSAAWRYPCEINELKPHAPEAEDMMASFWKRAAPKKTAPAPVTKEKPRFRIRADWRKIEDKNAESRKTEDRGIDDRKVENQSGTNGNAYQRPQRPTVAVAEERTVEAQVKYSESLDSIKQRYNDTVLKRGITGFSPSFSGRFMWLLLLIPALGMGMWIGNSWHKGKQPEVVAVTTAPAAADKPAAVSLQAAMEPEEDVAAEKSESTAAIVPANEKTEVHVASASKQPVPHVVADTHSAGIIPANAVPVAKKQGALIAPATTGTGTAKTVATTPAKTAATRQTIVAGTAPTPAAPEKAPAVVEKKTATASAQPAASLPVVAPAGKQISDYVSVKEELQQAQDGKQMRLHVKNNTNAPVDLVVLDLQYYDGNGRFKKGETLYVNHLSANDAVALNAPAVKNAQRIDYKVSLLSIEKNGVYLIAE